METAWLLCFAFFAMLALLCFAAFLLPPLAAPAGNGFDVRHHSGSVPPGQGRTEQNKDTGSHQAAASEARMNLNLNPMNLSDICNWLLHLNIIFKYYLGNTQY